MSGLKCNKIARMNTRDDDHSLDRHLGHAIRDQRLRNHLTIADVAALAGISRGMLSKIENGQASTSLDALRADRACARRVDELVVPRLRCARRAARNW